MIVLIIVASVLLASISIQFKKRSQRIPPRKIRKEGKRGKGTYYYVLSTTTYPLTTENLDLIFKDKIHELAHIHNIEINIYSLEGELKII
jgi:hypothetical protein